MDKVFERYTGVNKDMIEAFRRSFAYDYDKYSRFTAVKAMENNTLTLVNSSYADVWDYLKKPMRAFLNQIGEKDKKITFGNSNIKRNFNELDIVRRPVSLQDKVSLNESYNNNILVIYKYVW